MKAVQDLSTRPTFVGRIQVLEALSRLSEVLLVAVEFSRVERYDPDVIDSCRSHFADLLRAIDASAIKGGER